MPCVAIRNIIFAGRRTNVRLEPVMWEALRDIADRQNRPINEIVAEIESRRTTLNLTAAIRVYVVEYYQTAPARTEWPVIKSTS